MACRATTCSLHICRSLAINLMPSQVFPISLISFSTVCRHVILGQPLLRFPSGVQCKVVFAIQASWRATWPIHLQRLLIRMVAIGSVPHRSKRSLFEMTLGQKMHRIRRRLLVWNVESYTKQQLDGGKCHPVYLNRAWKKTCTLIWDKYFFPSGK